MTRPRRESDMTQKQWVGILVALIIAFLLYVGREAVHTRDTAIATATTVLSLVASKEDIIKEYDASLAILHDKVSKLESTQGLASLELRYAREDREEFKSVLKENQKVMNSVNFTLMELQAKTMPEIDALKEAVDDVKSRLSKAGI